jgi:hypothetical protein
MIINDISQVMLGNIVAQTSVRDSLTPVSSLLGVWSTEAGTVPLRFAILDGSSKGILGDVSSSSESTSADDTCKCLLLGFTFLVIAASCLTGLVRLRVAVRVVQNTLFCAKQDGRQDRQVRVQA